MKTGKNQNIDAEWRRICSAMIRDSVRIRVPRAFLPTLSLFFHHVSDAMAGDDRPDHGLSKMRQDRGHYKIPFRFLYGKVRQTEKKMSAAHNRKSIQFFRRYLELLAEQDRQFAEKLKLIRKKSDSDRA